MAFFDSYWYVNSVAYAAVTGWAQSTAKSAGALIRQTATPTFGNERVFIALNTGTTKANPEPTWTVTRGGKTTDNDITWQECTGASAVSGDVTNTPNWTTVKGLVVTLGQIIKNNAATHYFIASTGGTTGSGSEPSFNTTAGQTTADNTVTWTCIGAVGSFSAWQGAHKLVVNSLASTWHDVGDKVFVSSNHSESDGSNSPSMAGQGTYPIPTEIYCVNSALTMPPVAADVTTGAVVASSTGAVIWSGRSMYVVGIESSGGVSVNFGNNTVHSWQRFDNCRHGTVAAAGGTAIGIGSSSTAVPARIEWNECDLSIGGGNTAVGMTLRLVIFSWRNNALDVLKSGSSVPTTLIPTALAAATFGHSMLDWYGLDMSDISGTIVGSVGGHQGEMLMRSCKLHASATLITALVEPAGLNLDWTNVDSGSTNYKSGRHRYQGVQSAEITIVRTGGGSDGTTGRANKVVSTANCSWLRPFDCAPIAVWNEATGSPITLNVHGVWGGGAVPNNDEIWFDVEYLGSSASSLGSTEKGTKANRVASGAAHSADAGETWGGGTTKFKMSVTVTPQKKGWILVLPKVGRASDTFYYDPRVEIT